MSKAAELSVSGPASDLNRAAPAPEDRPIHEMGYVPDRCCGPPP